MNYLRWCFPRHWWSLVILRLKFKLSEIFSTSIELPFVGLSLVETDDYLQLLPVEGDSSFQDLLVEVKLNSYHHYSYGICLNMLNWQKLLAKVIRYLLICWTVFVLVLWKARFKDQSAKSYQHDAFYMYAENVTTFLRNQTVLNKLTGKFSTH